MNGKDHFEYKNFTYYLDGGNHKVITAPPTTMPPTIYKYYGNINHNFEAVQQSYLYLNHPFEFNDSIDSSELLLDFSNINFMKFHRFYERFPDVELNIKDLFERDKKNRFKEIRTYFYLESSKKFGLVSLTTNPLNVLMWSHYSSEDGFMIELDGKKLLENLIPTNKDCKNYCFRPVQYVKQLESIDVFQGNFKSPDIPFLYMTNVKRKEWDYEEEWRLSVYKTDMEVPLDKMRPGFKKHPGSEPRKAYYPEDCLERIVLGKYFFNGENCSAINSDGYYKMKPDKTRDFVNYLYEKHNDRLYMSGELQANKNFNRSVSKIKLHKKNENTFSIEELNEVFS